MALTIPLSGLSCPRDVRQYIYRRRLNNYHAYFTLPSPRGSPSIFRTVSHELHHHYRLYPHPSNPSLNLTYLPPGTENMSQRARNTTPVPTLTITCPSGITTTPTDLNPPPTPLPSGTLLHPPLPSPFRPPTLNPPAPIPQTRLPPPPPPGSLHAAAPPAPPPLLPGPPAALPGRPDPLPRRLHLSSFRLRLRQQQQQPGLGLLPRLLPHRAGDGDGAGGRDGTTNQRGSARGRGDGEEGVV